MSANSDSHLRCLSTCRCLAGLGAKLLLIISWPRGLQLRGYLFQTHGTSTTTPSASLFSMCMHAPTNLGTLNGLEVYASSVFSGAKPFTHTGVPRPQVADGNLKTSEPSNPCPKPDTTNLNPSSLRTPPRGLSNSQQGSWPGFVPSSRARRCLQGKV